MQHQAITILGIESSCDDTGAAVLRDGKILANIVANQLVHKQYGGVVPELASRAHQANIIPVVDEALKAAGVRKSEISAVAYTQGPGLLGSLLVGGSFAKSFASALGIPLIEVNHMQAHILAHFIQSPVQENKVPEFPFLCLTVSGGHTQLVYVEDYFKMTVIGETLDDAAGEAFDKSAKILGLPYPGGPLIDKFAQLGNPLAFKFPVPKIADLDFSFSGFKTAVLYFVKDNMAMDVDFIEKNKNDICASIQYTLVKILMEKLKAASDLKGVTQIAIAGGVSANSGLRKALLNNTFGWKVFIPKFEYCTDNAAMIAMTGYLKYQKQDFATSSSIPSPRMKI
ncbi:MAG: tRNA (adenosine(37)-N6)-threonylcarbamoyltransferase complex transferase subunit TsaD [Bacteroidetes bacterium]|nr:tRNA (adenosine(37)-N6)-threonylcarbamoyltransferase complex transferase subunit TsaD [Bacteroidota bacterium]